MMQLPEILYFMDGTNLFSCDSVFHFLECAELMRD